MSSQGLVPKRLKILLGGKLVEGANERPVENCVKQVHKTHRLNISSTSYLHSLGFGNAPLYNSDFFPVQGKSHASL